MPPLQVGDLVSPSSLDGWIYVGLTGRPDDPAAVRSYRKGEWVLELRARSNRTLKAKVVSIRTTQQDVVRWAEERRRRTEDPLPS
jgi:hypothetical protein